MKIPVIIAVIFIATLGRLSVPVLSQQIEVTSSKNDIVSSIAHLHKVFGHDRENFYVIKYVGSQYFLQKLDKDLNPVLEESIKLFKGIKTYELQAIFHFYNEIYIFVSFTRFSNITLYYQKLDKDNLKPLTELIEITTIENVKGSWADFHFALSRHETKLMIACRTKLVWSGAQFNEFYVFGENLNLVWKRKDSFVFSGQGPRDNQYLVDETGNVSILSLLKRESIASLIREVRNLYSIYRYFNDGNDFKEYPVTLNDNYIRGIKIIAGENGDLICAGLWSEIFKTGIKGTFILKIDGTSGKVVDLHLNQFDIALLEELAGLKEPMLREEEVISYVITDIVLREQGKCIVIAEQVFHQTYNTYNNLIITSLDAYGQVFWTRIIHKKQNFNYTSIAQTGINLLDYRSFIRETGFIDPITSNFCSYALMAPLDKSGIILFYNDDISNRDQTERLKAFNQPRKSYILALFLDEFGNITRTPLVAWKKKSLFPEPMRFYDTLSDTIVIPAFRNRNINYYKITADAIR